MLRTQAQQGATWVMCLNPAFAVNDFQYVFWCYINVSSNWDENAIFQLPTPAFCMQSWYDGQRLPNYHLEMGSQFVSCISVSPSILSSGQSCSNSNALSIIICTSTSGHIPLLIECKWCHVKPSYNILSSIHIHISKKSSVAISFQQFWLVFLGISNISEILDILTYI